MSYPVPPVELDELRLRVQHLYDALDLLRLTEALRAGALADLPEASTAVVMAYALAVGDQAYRIAGLILTGIPEAGR